MFVLGELSIVKRLPPQVGVPAYLLDVGHYTTQLYGCFQK